MSLPKDPRQKMINIMYLVLTALLALNVSSEILNAFKTIDLSLSESNNIIQKSNSSVLSSLTELTKDPSNREEALFWLPKAEKAQVFADAIYNEIEALKKDLKLGSGLKMDGEKEVYNIDNLEAATRIIVEGEKGKVLYTRLQGFRKDLSNLHPEIEKNVMPKIPLNLDAYNGKNASDYKKWSYEYFNMIPTIGAITILTKFQNDIRNSASQVITYCHNQVGAVKIPFTNFYVNANLNSDYLTAGQDLVITAGLGAYSDQAKPVVNIDGVNVPLNADGSAIYTAKANNMGLNSKRVRITFLNPKTGKSETIEKEVKFTVGSSSGLAVSFDKTRVFYKGQENSLTINGGGNAKNIKVSVNGSGASVKPGAVDGQFIVSCPQVGKTMLIVEDGQNSYKKEIEIKKVPDPTVTVGGVEGGNMQVGLFKQQTGVYANLKDFFFEGVKFDVISFTIAFAGKGFPQLTWADVNGATFNAKAKSLMSLCEPGTNITIGNIKLSEPGGGTRTFPRQISLILD